jgi:hypothetical protein
VGGHSKGSQFERTVCGWLSNWWEEGRSDIFWRSAASGARAKVRSYVGKKTFGQYGDIQATDPIGQPLIDLCSIELKRGYKNASVGDVMDADENRAKQVWQTFLEQVTLDQSNAGSPYWLLITKRDRRAEMIYMPFGLYTELLSKTQSTLRHSLPNLKSTLIIDGPKRLTIYGTLLKGFLAHVSADDIKTLRRIHLGKT